MLKLESFRFVEREMSQRPTCSYMCARYVGEENLTSSPSLTLSSFTVMSPIKLIHNKQEQKRETLSNNTNCSSYMLSAFNKNTPPQKKSPMLSYHGDARS